jgi:hypothetical protein
LQRLGLQAGEDPPAGGAQQDPLQGLADAQPALLVLASSTRTAVTGSGGPPDGGNPRAAPQVMIISRPAGSSSSWRLVSAYNSIARSVTVNRHGWVLCTDGARAATSIR